MIYFICILMTVIWAHQFFVKKNYYSALTYIWAGIIVPLFMYQLGWSSLIDKTESWMFNYIFVCLTVIVLFYTVMTNRMKPNPIDSKSTIVMTSKGRMLSPILNVGFLCLYLLENYLGSGSLIPGLKKIDIHTYSAPIISYFTNSQFIVIAFDYFAYKATKKKRYWAYILTVLAVPVITRSSRMQVMISMVQFVSLLLFTEAHGYVQNLKSRKNYKRIKRIVIALVVIIVFGLSAFTNYRMNHYGVYNLNYADEIGYTGPDWLSFLAVYYGYFPLSFNNLKINIINRTINHNFIGLYSFACLFFGILQLDNILNISVTGQISGRLITHSSATVPTGFWDFYYDYDFLCFIPMIVAMAICYYILKRASKEKNKLVFRTLYFWFIPLWFFMSFQNVIFGTTIIVVGILLEIVIRRAFILDYSLSIER